MDDLVYFHCIGQTYAAAEQVYENLNRMRPDKRLRPWLDKLDMVPGENLAQSRQAAFAASQFYVAFSDRDFSNETWERELDLPERGDGKGPELLYIVFTVRPVRLTEPGHFFIHRDAASTAQAIADQWVLLTEARKEILGRFKIQFFHPDGKTPANAAVFVQGFFVDGNAHGQSAQSGLVEVFNWAYQYLAVELSEDVDHVFQPWTKGNQTSHATIAAKADACREDIYQERLDAADAKAKSIIKMSEQFSKNWEIPWFLKGLICLKLKDHDAARFFFDVCIQLRKNSFLCHYYAAVNSLWQDMQTGMDALRALVASPQLLDDGWLTGLLDLPHRDPMLDVFRADERSKEALERLLPKFTKPWPIDKPESTQGYPPLPLTLSAFSIKNFHNIGSLAIKNLPAHAPWIFLTGDNGEGKTSILQALALSFYQRDGGHLAKENTQVFSMFTNQNSEVHVCVYGKDPIISNIHLFGYGAQRWGKTDTNHAGPADSLLGNQPLLDIEKVLVRLNARLTRNGLNDKEKEKIGQRRDHICETLARLMPGIDHVISDGDRVVYESRGVEVTKAQLSAGQRAVNDMVGDLMYRFHDSLNTQDVSFDEVSGVVLIDELENHLHARWQYEFVGTLSKVFPKVQFIASTHSPIPLLGAPEHSRVLKVGHDECNQATVELVEIDLKRFSPNNLLTSPVFNFNAFLEHSSARDMHPQDDYWDIQKEKSLDGYLRDWAERNIAPLT